MLLSTTHRSLRIRKTFSFVVACAFSLSALSVLAACGSGGSGPGPDGTGQGLEIVKFHQNGLDTVAANQTLRIDFSEPVDPSTVFSGSFVVKEGSTFGLQVAGTTYVDGSSIYFEPQLPSRCDLTDAGFKPGTTYRVLITGHPEEFAVKNTRGQPLSATKNYSFTTRAEGGVLPVFQDQIAGAAPVVTQITPADGSEAVTVATGNQIILDISENLDPCTVTTDSVMLTMVENGDPNLGSNVLAPNGNQSGFYAGTDTSDQVPGPLGVQTWGADASTTRTPAQLILASVEVVQSQASTQIVITPDFGKFPENSLLNVSLTAAIQDFGAQPLTAFSASFTTENLPSQTDTYVLDAAGETAFDDALSTADVNTSRSPSLIQGFLLLTGDGDNGPYAPTDTVVDPAYPNYGAGTCAEVPSDNTKDDFMPSADVILDTGATFNLCTNEADGSTAVVWQFQNFTIPSGITVRIIGVNPAIIHVQGDVNISSGGTLLAKGDGVGGTQSANGRQGRNGNSSSSTPIPGVTGGAGAAGGGDGGDSANSKGTGSIGLTGQHGSSGFGSDDTLAQSGQGIVGGVGGGHGNIQLKHTSSSANRATGTGGGGGGHAAVGGTGGAVPGTGGTLSGAADGAGGAKYGDTNATMRTPIAGAGGGAGGASSGSTSTSQWVNASAGSGGAGGGFVDISTLNGDIAISGSIDASGGRGGAGTGNANVTPAWNGSGAGGGGSGGGIRLLTPNNIILAGATVTTAGGAGGTGYAGAGATPNLGGTGSVGRIVMEAESIIGLADSTVVPTLGEDGFYSGPFDGTRFVGGGTRPSATTERVLMGPLDPDYMEPVAGDFLAGIPAAATNGPSKTAIMIEVRGFQLLPDGTADNPSPEPMWTTVGYFTDSGAPNSPNWIPGANPPLADIGVLPADNDGLAGGMNSVDFAEYLQLRVTCYLPIGMEPFDPGSFLDRWTIRFTSNL